MSEMIVWEYQRQIADVTRDIRIKTGQFLLDAIEIGRLLYEAKAMVPQGGWMQYVEEELPFSQSWANNYMRLYKEYGGEQLSVFGNSQATAKLSPTQALELLALPAHEREEFMETHDVENMSTRELKQAIREKDEELQAAETRADNHATRADEAEKQVEQLRSELSEAEKATAVSNEKVDKLKTQLAKAKENEKAAKAALEEAKKNPEIPEAVMEQMRQQVAADAAKEATEDLQKKLDEALAAADTARKSQKATEEKLEAAQKAVKMANPEVAVLQSSINHLLSEFKDVHKNLLAVLKSDPEAAEKIKPAILGTIDQMRNLIASSK